jgi:hypothetical protein
MPRAGMVFVDWVHIKAASSTAVCCKLVLSVPPHDADWFREALKDKLMCPCISGRKSRGKAVRCEKRRYRRSNRIEIMFGRLKDWRSVATRFR